MNARNEHALRSGFRVETRVGIVTLLAILVAWSTPTAMRTASAQSARAFCSELVDGRTRTVGCQLAGRIRVDVYRNDGEFSEQRLIWILDSKTNEMALHDLTLKKTVENPLARTLLELNQNPERLRAATRSKQVREARIATITAIPGKSSKNDIPASACTWYELQGPGSADEGSLEQFENACIARFDDDIVASYLELLRLVESMDRRHDPLELSGLPLMNWRLPLATENGWVKPGHLPSIYVTGSKDPDFKYVRRMDFRYFFKEMETQAFHYAPDWD